MPNPVLSVQISLSPVQNSDTIIDLFFIARNDFWSLFHKQYLLRWAENIQNKVATPFKHMLLFRSPPRVGVAYTGSRHVQPSVSGRRVSYSVFPYSGEKQVACSCSVREKRPTTFTGRSLSQRKCLERNQVWCVQLRSAGAYAVTLYCAMSPSRSSWPRWCASVYRCLTVYTRLCLKM